MPKTERENFFFPKLDVISFKKKKIAAGVRQKTDRFAYEPVGRAFDIIANHSSRSPRGTHKRGFGTK